jgi:hypothetical protein
VLLEREQIEPAPYMTMLTKSRGKEKIPTGLIVTGPNIASQELLFGQLADRIRNDTGALVVTFRSGDGSNLKTVLKKLIRDATNQDHDDEDERLTGSAQDVSYSADTLPYELLSRNRDVNYSTMTYKSFGII